MNKIKKLKLDIKDFGLFIIFNVVGILPIQVNDLIAYIIGKFSSLFSTKTKSVITRNLKICFPELAEADLNSLVIKNILENSKLALEFPTIWLAKEKKILSLIIEVNHKELINEFVEKQQPIILAVPHIGNWELFWCWVQINFTSFGMYSPIKYPKMNRFMFLSRQRFGGEAFSTDPKGIMSLIRRVKKGGVMMILTDQAPRLGSGIYSPFYGQDAYTMSLLHKIVQKTNANLLFGCCLRKNNERGFSINIFKPDFDSQTSSTEEFNAGMNKQIESIIALAPEQYQWSYKRFKRQENGVNFYSK